MKGDFIYTHYILFYTLSILHYINILPILRIKKNLLLGRKQYRSHKDLSLTIKTYIFQNKPIRVSKWNTFPLSHIISEATNH